MTTFVVTTYAMIRITLTILTSMTDTRSDGAGILARYRQFLCCELTPNA